MTAALYTDIFVENLTFLFNHKRLVSLPNATVALLIREVISASIEASLLIKPPRYLKMDTAFNLAPSIVTTGAS